jgi:hypothetical protein
MRGPTGDTKVLGFRRRSPRRLRRGGASSARPRRQGTGRASASGSPAALRAAPDSPGLGSRMAAAAVVIGGGDGGGGGRQRKTERRGRV